MAQTITMTKRSKKNNSA